jgi:tetratricopeptide (TPR) repeat protein
MKYLPISLLLVFTSLPIFPAIAETELDRMIRESEEELGASEDAAATTLKITISDQVADALKKDNSQYAIERLTFYRKQLPNDPYSYSQIGQIKEEYLGDFDGAIQEYSQAVAKAQKLLEIARKKSGETSAKSKEYKKDVAVNLNRIVSVLLLTANPTKDLAVLQQAKKMLDLADAHQRLLDSLLNRARGNELQIRSGKLNSASLAKATTDTQKMFDKAVEVNPKYAASYLYRGTFKARVLKDLAGAQRDLRQALQLAKANNWKAGIDRSSAALKSLGEDPQSKSSIFIVKN